MDPCQEKNKPRHASSSPPSPNYWPSSFHFASDVIVGIIRRIYFACLASGLVHCSILSYIFMARWACVIHAFIYIYFFFFLREELQDRMRGVYDIQYIYLTTQSVCVWPSEAAGHEYYTVFFFYFQTVLILWLNRFWPWVVLAKQFEFLFFPPTLSALFHLTLPLRHACASHLWKGPSPCLQMLSYSNELPPSDLGLLFFSPTLPLGHPESSSRGHLSMINAFHLACRPPTIPLQFGQRCAKMFSGWPSGWFATGERKL